MRALLFVALLLSGCANRAINACPFVTEYSRETQAQAASELKMLPPGSVLGVMITDYGKERAKLRACHA